MSKDEEYKKPNTRPVPILITLAAAGISTVVSIIKQVSFGDFVWSLLITVIIFGILGCFVRVFLDMGFKVDKKEEEEKASEAEDEEAEESDDDSAEESESEEETQE